MQARMHACICLRMHFYLHVRMEVRMHAWTRWLCNVHGYLSHLSHRNIHLYVYFYTSIYIYIYIYTHIHT